MKYTVVDSSEWMYPDRMEYASSTDRIAIFSPRNSYATVQILLSEVPEDGIIQVTTQGFQAELFELVPVMVESNPFLNEENALPHYPERWAPYLIYDCLKPLGKTVKPVNGVVGIYFSVRIDKNATVGKMTGTVTINTLVIPVEIMVYSVVVPEETLKMIVGYSSTKTAQYHHVEAGSAENKRLDNAYLTMLRRMRQNMLYVGGVQVTDLGNNQYAFDFSAMEEFVRNAMQLGYKYFNAPSVGGRKSWKESTILVHGMPAMSYEAYRYLSQYLPALQAMLKQNGWIDNFYMGIADEPNAANATEFRALCGLVRRFVPDIKLIDAMSFGDLYGALNVWVPLNAEFDKHQEEFDKFRENEDEIWHYVCCGPRSEGYINRFMDYPLLSTHYLFWGNYKYDLKGYLHWAANVYQPGQDPFTQNCPSHTNCDSTTTLPSGDTHVVYPGDGEPWMSMRLEAHRESAEEYELFRLLAQKNPSLADSLCNTCFHSFKDVEYDTQIFKNTRQKLIEALS